MSLKSASPALAAALLFGASTPAAKVLVGNVPPLMLAGLLYLGSGIGLAVVLLLRRMLPAAGRPAVPLAIPRAEWPWLAGAVLVGGLLGPVLLMLGLARTDAAAASLLLNVEGVLTALIAWVVFRENADRQVVLGMVAIVAGGVLLSWEPGGTTLSPGSLLVMAACLCWAVDNNLTRKVSTNDAVLVACIKGLIAGLGNTTLALLTGAGMPEAPVLALAAVVGFLGYGVSLSLFVVGLRTLGTARAGAYFSVAPLFGVVLSLLIWPQIPGGLFWGAALLMAGGVWLHVRERHEDLSGILCARHTMRNQGHGYAEEEDRGLPGSGPWAAA